ncbi:putative holin-like toxin [Shouchella lonarensis]|nr:putative holin-like toxin [Shouchella lonarensis]
MSAYETLSLMILFAMLVIRMLSFVDKEKDE